MKIWTRKATVVEQVKPRLCIDQREGVILRRNHNDLRIGPDSEFQLNNEHQLKPGRNNATQELCKLLRRSTHVHKPPKRLTEKCGSVSVPRAI